MTCLCESVRVGAAHGDAAFGCGCCGGLGSTESIAGSHVRREYRPGDPWRLALSQQERVPDWTAMRLVRRHREDVTGDLSRLKRVSVREVWPHEAHDFARWLLDNVDVLADVSGIKLELTEAEHKVGGFALDLVGIDLDSGATVIMENHLEQGDHRHLGQLLTYTEGTDPTTIVWCTPLFRDEHRAALDWLNEHTDEDRSSSPSRCLRCAPTTACPGRCSARSPNPTTGANRYTQKRQLPSRAPRGLPTVLGAAAAGVSGLDHHAEAQHPELDESALRACRNRLRLGSHPQGPSITLYFEDDQAEENQLQFEQFKAHRDFLEHSLGTELVFDPMEGRKACRIRLDSPEGGSIGNDDEQGIYLKWFLDWLEPLRDATQQVRGLMSAADG